MRKAVIAGCVAAAAFFAGQAYAATYIEEVSQSRYVRCYSKVYVPARVLVDTRGVPVRGAAAGWETGAAEWNYVRSPAVYIQTRRVVAPDHYTLVQKGCP